MTEKTEPMVGIVEISQSEICEQDSDDCLLVFLLDEQMEQQYLLTFNFDESISILNYIDTYKNQLVKVFGIKSNVYTASILANSFNFPTQSIAVEAIDIIPTSLNKQDLIDLADEYMIENYSCIANWAKQFSWRLFANSIIWNVRLSPSWISDERFIEHEDNGDYIEFVIDDDSKNIQDINLKIDKDICQDV